MVSDVPGSAGVTPTRIVIASKSARVNVVARGNRLIVRGAAFTTDPDGTVTVTSQSASLDIECPEDCDLVIGVESGRVSAKGRLGAVRVASESGRVQVESAREMDVRSRSGRVEVGTIERLARVSLTSGRVTVARAGSVDIAVHSGRVVVRDCGDATVQSLSGRVELATRGGCDVDIRTTSGRVSVSVPRGCCPAVSTDVRSGRVDCAVPLGNDGTISVQAVSGRVTIEERS